MHTHNIYTFIKTNVLGGPHSGLHQVWLLQHIIKAN